MSPLSTLLQRYRVGADPIRTERRLELLVLAALLLVLLQLCWLGLRWFTAPGVDPVPPAPDSLAVLPPAGPGAISTEQSLQLQSRPLFWASRQPVEGLRLPQLAEGRGDALDEALGEPARRLEKLLITGVFGGGDSGGAIVSYRGSKLRLRVGEDLDGWILQRVEPGVAVFVSAGVIDERALTPSQLSAGAGTAPATGSAAAAAAAAEQVAAGQPATTSAAAKQPPPAAAAQSRTERSLSSGAPRRLSSGGN